MRMPPLSPVFPGWYTMKYLFESRPKREKDEYIKGLCSQEYLVRKYNYSAHSPYDSNNA